jgi:hypothetical protein
VTFITKESAEHQGVEHIERVPLTAKGAVGLKLMPAAEGRRQRSFPFVRHFRMFDLQYCKGQIHLLRREWNLMELARPLEYRDKHSSEGSYFDSGRKVSFGWAR